MLLNSKRDTSMFVYLYEYVDYRYKVCDLAETGLQIIQNIYKIHI